MHKMSTHFRDNLWKTSFDSDSHPLMFDDGASASIMNDLQDFIQKPTLFNYALKVRNIQIVTASRPRAVLGLPTSTTNTLTIKQ